MPPDQESGAERKDRSSARQGDREKESAQPRTGQRRLPKRRRSVGHLRKTRVDEGRKDKVQRSKLGSSGSSELHEVGRRPNHFRSVGSSYSHSSPGKARPDCEEGDLTDRK